MAELHMEAAKNVSELSTNSSLYVHINKVKYKYRNNFKQKIGC